MDYLNWVAEHWVLTIVLVMLFNGCIFNLARLVIIACKK